MRTLLLSLSLERARARAHTHIHTHTHTEPFMHSEQLLLAAAHSAGTLSPYSVLCVLRYNSNPDTEAPSSSCSLPFPSVCLNPALLSNSSLWCSSRQLSPLSTTPPSPPPLPLPHLWAKECLKRCQLLFKWRRRRLELKEWNRNNVELAWDSQVCVSPSPFSTMDSMSSASCVYVRSTLVLNLVQSVSIWRRWGVDVIEAVTYYISVMIVQWQT